MVTTIAPFGDAIVCAYALAGDPISTTPAAAAINRLSMRIRIARSTLEGSAVSTRARTGGFAAERAWCIQVRAVVDANGEPMHQFSSEPSGDRTETDSDDPEHRRRKGWQVSFNRTPRQPADREQQHDDDVADAVIKPDGLRASFIRDRQPVDETEDGGEEPADDSTRDVPVRHNREGRMIRDHIGDVGQHRHDKKTQGEDDEHRMNRMSEELRLAFHSTILLSKSRQC